MLDEHGSAAEAFRPREPGPCSHAVPEPQHYAPAPTWSNHGRPNFDEAADVLCDHHGLGVVSWVPPIVPAESEMTQAYMDSNVRTAAKRSLRPPIAAGGP